MRFSFANSLRDPRLAAIAVFAAVAFTSGATKNAIELLKPTLAVMLVAGLVLRFGPERLRRHLHMDTTGLLLVSFALLSTAQGMQYLVHTEIPSLRKLLRLIYTLFLLSCLWRPLSQRPPIQRIVATSIFFASFLFKETYFSSPERSAPVLLLLVCGLIDEPGKATGSSQQNVGRGLGVPAILGGAALLSLVASNIWNANYPAGGEAVIRLLAGFFIVGLASLHREQLTPGFLAGCVVAMILAHSLLFGSALFARAAEHGVETLLLSKANAYLGTNSNDVSGYLITGLSLCVGYALAPRSVARWKKTAAAIALGLALMVMVATKARLSWPVAIVSVLAAAYFALQKSVREGARRKALWTTMAALTSALVVVGLMLLQSDAMEYLRRLDTFDIRRGLWLRASQVLAANPLAGTGSETYPLLASLPLKTALDSPRLALLGEFYRDSSTFVHCHNLILQLWLDGGLVYSLGLVWLAGVGAFRAFTVRRDSSDSVILRASGITLVACLAQGMANFHMMDLPTWFGFWFLLAIVLPRSLARSEVTSPASAQRSSRLRTYATLVITVMVGYHLISMGLVGHALQLLDPFRSRNRNHDIVLAQPPKAIRAGPRLRRASLAMERSLRLGPPSASHHALAGEIYFFASRQKPRPVDAPRQQAAARQHFLECLRLRSTSIFCQHRLAQLARGRAEQNRYRQSTRKHNPFRLLMDQRLRPF